MTLGRSSETGHPRFARREALQVGASGILGLGMNHLSAFRAEANTGVSTRARSVIYIFLSGGLSQHDSFDPKPEAPDNIRGEFDSIATNTPGIRICEHLPQLARRSHLWSLVRSLSHPSNDHSAGHHIMMTGRSTIPVGFNGSAPTPNDHPCMPSIVGAVTRPRNNLPPAAVLPERFVHYSGRVLPGQFGGSMGPRRDPWFIEASPFDNINYGAYPEYEFDHQERERKQNVRRFQAPSLSLPQGLDFGRLDTRLSLLKQLDNQRLQLDQQASVAGFDRYRQAAISLLVDPRVKHALDVVNAEPAAQDRYGRNSFGWSLLMARRLVEAGVNMVQVNLGNNETWDTHGNAFPHLKDSLFPPTDKALSALLDDLQESGMLDDTLIVMAGEFGRTPKTSTLTQFYKGPGRDHWGAVQTVWFAGGGTRGGTVVGSSDKTGGFPADNRQTPENMAATIYHSLGLPPEIVWTDIEQRPHSVYYAEPIWQLL